MSDTGVMRSAIFLLSLGEDEAAEVLKYLGPREVEKIGAAMAGLSNVTREQIDETLDSFHEATAGRSSLNVDSSEYVRSVLVKALGDDKAVHVINRILKDNDTPGIDHLRWMSAEQVAALIRHEHPQIIATILVHLEPSQAGETLALFDEGLRNDAIHRIATLDSVQPAALQELNDVLGRLLTGKSFSPNKPMGGIKAAAEILNFVGTHEESIMDNLRGQDEELAQKIEDEMFVFDNLLDVDDKGIQLMLREIQSESLIIALKGATQELRDKIFKNMSSRAAEMLKEDLDSKGPVRLSEVEAEQKMILQTVKRLADEGQIVIAGKGGEEFV
jgi:flagellar motor switch protein FliG